MNLVGLNLKEKFPSHLDELLKSFKSSQCENIDDCKCLATALLRRAPTNYLNETSLESRKHLILTAEKAFNAFSSSKDSLAITPYEKPGAKHTSGFIILMEDRPFIIDTIDQFIITQKRTAHCFTHAIIQTNSNLNISISYIEFERLSPSKDEQLKHGLEALLQEVVVITNDFLAMKKTLREHLKISDLKTNNPELLSFVEWILNDGFVFFGLQVKAEPATTKKLGLLSQSNLPLEEAIKTDCEYLSKTSVSLFCSKSTTRSVIHRQEFMDLISIKFGGSTVITLVGLFTSKTRNQEALRTPIVGSKISSVLSQEGLVPNSHDYKESLSLFDTLPKSDLLHLTIGTISDYFQTITHARSELCVSAIITRDRIERFDYIITILPSSRFSQQSTAKIEKIINEMFGNEPRQIHSHAILSDHPLVFIRSMIPVQNRSHEIDIRKFEQAVNEATRGWDGELEAILRTKYEEGTATRLLSFYTEAFPSSYRTSHTAAQALDDIEIMEVLSAERELHLDFTPTSSFEYDSLYKLRIYRRGEYLALSDIIPFLENAGFFVVSETVSPIANQRAVWVTIYDLYISPRIAKDLDPKDIQGKIIGSLEEILSRSVENDKLNHLILSPGISTKQIALLRALVRYLVQIRFAITSNSSMVALIENPGVTALLIEYFEAKFTPSLGLATSDERGKALDSIYQEILDKLREISQLSQDRLLRAMVNVIRSTLRTNYFINPSSRKIVLKLDCSQVLRLPEPRPYREIFVSDQEFQGVHLRGGPIARGGLRWSSRRDDFRTEVLGLMKTQTVKNSIIVPVGAKGGFIVHKEPKDRVKLSAKVEEVYKNFIRSLLEITDNRVGDDIVTPQNVICFDEPDPYLVVAADRGTATFSDIANGIAENEFGFWLGDAFASGGATGYNHKALGITAKGAWECALRHFKEIGIDTEERTFTVVGIGDMSGDVFGNGLLRSKNAKLLAAFDHRHIFLDPDPDPTISFEERSRLFKLPSSSWMDYKQELLSPGGQIVSRFEKEIQLSPQIQKALETDLSCCSGNELIKIILRAPTDLLWNGGIGTYIKASDEVDSEVPDSSNEDVRVSANELRARIVSEGGNLGVTQRARIEFSFRGGRINTDAVDNSGGVDMSDFEVNLKLLFRSAILNKTVTVKERDAVLLSCEKDACERVIARNRSQSLVLSLAVKRSRANLTFYRDLIAFFVKHRDFKPANEFLPTEETFEKRRLAKAGLSRPVLAILIAQTKMWVFEELLASSLPDEDFLIPLLKEYFPDKIVEAYPHLIEEHPLRREIIATQISNLLVERMGSTFIYRLSEESNASATEVIRAFLIADEVTEARNTAFGLQAIDGTKTAQLYIAALLKLQENIDATARWFLGFTAKNTSFSDLVLRYKIDFQTLIKHTEDIITPSDLVRHRDSVKEFTSHGLPLDTASALIANLHAPVYLDIAQISHQTGASLLEVAKLYSVLASELDVGDLINQTNSLQSTDVWQTLAAGTLVNNIRKGATQLCKNIITEVGLQDEGVSAYFESRKNELDRYRETITKLRKEEGSIASLLVVTNILDNLGRMN